MLPDTLVTAPLAAKHASNLAGVTTGRDNRETHAGF
jgi:hypothetical protein